MNLQTGTVVFLRLTALVLLYFIVINTINIFYTVSFSDWDTLLLLLIATGFLYTAAIVFWFFPIQLSNRLLKNTKTPTSASPNTVQLVHAGTIILGLVVFTLALIELVRWVIYYGLMNAQPQLDPGSLLTVGLFNIFTRLIIGVLLLSKSYWLTRFLIRLNSPVTTKNQDD